MLNSKKQWNKKFKTKKMRLTFVIPYRARKSNYIVIN